MTTATIRPLTAAALTQALTDLGTTPDHVADTLTLHGYRGRRGCPRRCPIAVYLLAEFPDAGDVDVNVDEATLHAAGHPIRVPLPIPVQQFVTRFDYAGITDRRAFAGWYDHLDASLPAAEGLPS